MTGMVLIHLESEGGNLTMHACGKCATEVKGQFNIFISHTWTGWRTGASRSGAIRWRWCPVTCGNGRRPRRPTSLSASCWGHLGTTSFPLSAWTERSTSWKVASSCPSGFAHAAVSVLCLKCCLGFFFTSFHFRSPLFILVQRMAWASLVPTRPTWPRCPPPSSTTRCAAAGNETRTRSATLRRHMWCVCTTSTSWPNPKPASPSNTQRQVGGTPGLWVSCFVFCF